MVKNVNGGKHKNQARKHAIDCNKKLRLRGGELELYAVVLSKLGGNKLEVYCMDGAKRLCIMPGKFTNRRRDNMVEKGSWILIGLRDWETAKERENCDLLEAYNENEKKKLKNTINENWNVFEPKTVEEDVVHFTNDYEEQQETIRNEIRNNDYSVTMNEIVDIDDI
jgi:initiation factor 1A